MGGMRPVAVPEHVRAENNRLWDASAAAEQRAYDVASPEEGGDRFTYSRAQALGRAALRAAVEHSKTVGLAGHGTPAVIL